MNVNRIRGLLPDTFGAYVIDNVLVAGKYDIPVVGYFGEELPDYLALYSNVGEYKKTSNTCVTFYQYDETFDSMNGLWNAIVHKNQRLLQHFKNRFSGVKFITCPDYSITGDMPLCMQIFNVYRSRVVAIWLRENCNCTIIPNLRFNNEKSYDYCFDGIAYNSVVCFSILGLCSKPVDVKNIINGLHETIIRIRPKAIIVYGECTDSKFNMLFKECLDNQIVIIRPNSRRKNFWEGHCYGRTK